MHVRVGEQRHYQPLAILRCSGWAYSLETLRSVFQVMSIRSPTLTLSNTVGSTTRRLYFHPFGPTKVIDDALLSMSAMLAVILTRPIGSLPSRANHPFGGTRVRATTFNWLGPDEGGTPAV